MKPPLYKFLQEIGIEVTNRCNFRCLHCEILNCSKSFLSRKELTCKQFCSVLKQAAGMRIPSVHFTGGEPFLRKDIWDLLECAKKNKFQICVSTNASLITNAIAARLASFSLSPVAVTVYGMDERTYASVTGVKGAYGKVFGGIELLLKHKLELIVRMPLLKKTLPQWDAFEAFFKARKIKKVYPIVKIHPTYEGGTIPFRHVPSSEKLKEFFIRHPELIADPEAHSRTPQESGLVCMAGLSGITVTPNGQILPCYLIRKSDANIRTHTLRQAWESAYFNEVRGFYWEDFPKCLHCRLLKFCRPCPGKFELNSGDFRKPDAVSCAIASAKEKAFRGRKR